MTQLVAILETKIMIGLVNVLVMMTIAVLMFGCSAAAIELLADKNIKNSDDLICY